MIPDDYDKPMAFLGCVFTVIVVILLISSVCGFYRFVKNNTVGTYNNPTVSSRQ